MNTPVNNEVQLLNIDSAILGITISPLRKQIESVYDLPIMVISCGSIDNPAVPFYIYADRKDVDVASYLVEPIVAEIAEKVIDYLVNHLNYEANYIAIDGNENRHYHIHVENKFTFIESTQFTNSLFMYIINKIKPLVPPPNTRDFEYRFINLNYTNEIKSFNRGKVFGHSVKLHDVPYSTYCVGYAHGAGHEINVDHVSCQSNQLVFKLSTTDSTVTVIINSGKLLNLTDNEVNILLEDIGEYVFTMDIIHYIPVPIGSLFNQTLSKLINQEKK